MDCDFEEESASKQFWSRLDEKAYINRIPIRGVMDLTSRCNLQCVHCYINTPVRRKQALSELPTERIHRLIDEITEAGCLFFWLTGGEPLLHPDFCGIYRHLRENGVGVILYTNATLLKDQHFTLFRELRPEAIEVSVYGATRGTYEAITQQDGSFDRCMTAIRNVREAGINLRLRTVLMKQNRYEYVAIRQIAESLGCSFRSTSTIFPSIDGDTDILRWRLPPEEAVPILLQNPIDVQAWVKIARRPRKSYYPPDALYECAAGASAFHVSAEGRLQACLHVRNPKYTYDLRNGTFMEGWLGPLSGVPQCKKEANSPCKACVYHPYCTYCPAKLNAEPASRISQNCEGYRCEMARRISETVKGLGYEA